MKILAPVFPRLGPVVLPVPVMRLERASEREFNSIFQKIYKKAKSVVDRIEFKSVQVNRDLPIANAVRYEFLSEPLLIEAYINELNEYIEQLLMSGRDIGLLWFTESFVEPAYREGTNLAYRNLSRQSGVYRETRESIQRLISSRPYMARIAILRTRQFELMQGLTSTTKETIAQALTGGLINGLGPRQIAKNIQKAVNGDYKRGLRIARTEIGNAHRTARIQEAFQAQDDTGLRVMMLHVSAFSPSTRLTHAERSGKLFTMQEVQEWYSQDANAINCKCTQLEIFVDENDEPYSSTVIDMQAEIKERMLPTIDAIKNKKKAA